MAQLLQARARPTYSIPPFDTGFDILARLAPLYRPKARLTVSEWAAAHLDHYDPEALPFLAEIMDACSDPETSEVADMGPAQGGKSLVGLAFMGWSIEHDPADFLVCQPDKALMQDFVVRRINPMVAHTDALKAALLPNASADNIFLKQFRGMLLTSVWPVGSQFRARPVPRGWLDDYDQFPADIDGTAEEAGQGSAIELLDGRMTTFEGRDTKLVSSSPAREDGGGIEAFVLGGTNERLTPECPECGDRVEPDIRRDLKFDAGTPDEAEASAHVVCPANGCVLEPPARRLLLNSCLTLPNRGFVAKNVAAGKRRRSFHRDGLLAFTSWGKLARQWREAQIAWEARQDEGPLRTFFNTKGGYNYRSILSGEKPVETDTLKKRREKGWKSGTVPRGVRVIEIVIDVQHNRFECAAIGYGEGFESWLIKRWHIDALADGLTMVEPFTHPEHWRILLPLFDKMWPLAEKGPDGKPIGHAPTLAVVIDTGGSDRKGDQATAGAKFFWQAARGMGVHASRITLVKGGSNPKGKLMPPGQFADQRIRGGVKRNSAKLWLPNVHAIKNIIDARLRRDAPGPGYIHLPGDLDEIYLDEITAEELVDGKWKKLRPRNETLDLLVYGYAGLLRPPFAQSRTDMRWVPRDFRIDWSAPATPDLIDAAAAEPAAAEIPVPSQAAESQRAAVVRPDPKPHRPKPARSRWVQKPKSSWLDRRR